LSKEKPLKMSEFLKNKYFSNEKSPRYILIPEKNGFLKKKVLVLPEFKENLLVLPDFLKNKYFVEGKLPKNV
jgi:hypothetical protein